MLTAAVPRQDEIEIECHTDLHAFLCALEADSSLFLPSQLRKRLTALDRLDVAFGGFAPNDSNDPDAPNHPEYSKRPTHSPLHLRATALRTRLEAANSKLYRSVRSDIARGNQPHALLHWLEDSAGNNQPGSPLPGLGFDHQDELVSGVLQLLEPSQPTPQPLSEMVPYQPTPVRHVRHLIAAAAIAEDDIFVDLGSGLGHVPLLVSMLTGARSLGIEVQAAYVASAQKCAQSLHLNRVQFIAQDTRHADLSRGTVFYLYSPFKGSILSDVLSALRTESLHRPIKICSLGPCTHKVLNEKWLKAIVWSDTGRIAVFDSL